MPPSRDRFAVSGFRRVRVGGFVFCLRHRRIEFGLLPHSVQLFMRRIAAIHQPFLGGLSAPFGDLFDHRRPLSLVVALWVTTSTPTITWLALSVAYWAL
ncbi:MAG: hypothetical protein ACREV1_08595 [Gammaproteobacteria bacterium]